MATVEQDRAGNDYPAPQGMGRAAFFAMGTTISVIAPERALNEALRLTRGLFDDWDRALSRFRSESELSRLNAAAGLPTAVSPLLFTVLRTALAAAMATRGIFDPTVLQRMIEIGYDRTFESLAPRQPEARVARPARMGGWRAIELHEDPRIARLPPGVGLDFGGIAKGMAVDAALELLDERGLTPAMVNAGGDLAVRGLPPDAPSWSIATPGKAERWVIGLERGALATSGVSRRQWMQGDTPRHHVIDPRTGEPAASQLWSVTAVAGTCAQCEVAAKTALILGRDEGARFIERARLGALLVEESGAWIVAGAWPLGGMRRIDD
ncbi:MAG TPA: FAD:protein FMN transferase [Ktedonobacterales bacterium]